MLKRKHPRQRGKISLARYFQEFKEGDLVAVRKEHSQSFGYSSRLQGRTGRIIAKQGKAYCIEVSDLGKPKRYFIYPIHLVRHVTRSAP